MSRGIKVVIGMVVFFSVLRLLLPALAVSGIFYNNLNWSFIGDSGLAGAAIAFLLSKIIESVIYGGVIFGVYFWLDRGRATVIRSAMVVGIIIVGVLVGVVIDHVKAQVKTTNIVSQIYAPFLQAGKFHPRVTLVSYKAVKNESTGFVDGLDVKVKITASSVGNVEVIGGLFDGIQDKNTMNSPEASEAVRVTLGKDPVEIDFHLTRTGSAEIKTREYVLENFEKMNIFGIYMFYKPEAADYSAAAELSYNPIDDVDDSGESTNVLEDPDIRTVFYDLGNWSE